jgi:hypothetical protein
LLNANLEPIREKKSRAGLAAYVRSALEALLDIHLMIELNPRPSGYQPKHGTRAAARRAAPHDLPR